MPPQQYLDELFVVNETENEIHPKVPSNIDDDDHHRHDNEAADENNDRNSNESSSDEVMMTGTGTTNLGDVGFGIISTQQQQQDSGIGFGYGHNSTNMTMMSPPAAQPPFYNAAVTSSSEAVSSQPIIASDDPNNNMMTMGYGVSSPIGAETFAQMSTTSFAAPGSIPAAAQIPPVFQSDPSFASLGNNNNKNGNFPEMPSHSALMDAQPDNTSNAQNLGIASLNNNNNNHHNNFAEMVSSYMQAAALDIQTNSNVNRAESLQQVSGSPIATLPYAALDYNETRINDSQNKRKMDTNPSNSKDDVATTSKKMKKMEAAEVRKSIVAVLDHMYHNDYKHSRISRKNMVAAVANVHHRSQSMVEKMLQKCTKNEKSGFGFVLDIVDEKDVDNVAAAPLPLSTTAAAAASSTTTKFPSTEKAPQPTKAKLKKAPRPRKKLPATRGKGRGSSTKRGRRSAAVAATMLQQQYHVNNQNPQEGDNNNHLKLVQEGRRVRPPTRWQIQQHERWLQQQHQSVRQQQTAMIVRTQHQEIIERHRPTIHQRRPATARTHHEKELRRQQEAAAAARAALPRQQESALVGRHSLCDGYDNDTNGAIHNIADLALMRLQQGLVSSYGSNDPNNEELSIAVSLIGNDEIVNHGDNDDEISIAVSAIELDLSYDDAVGNGNEEIDTAHLRRGESSSTSGRARIGIISSVGAAINTICSLGGGTNHSTSNGDKKHAQQQEQGEEGNLEALQVEDSSMGEKDKSARPTQWKKMIAVLVLSIMVGICFKFDAQEVILGCAQNVFSNMAKIT